MELFKKYKSLFEKYKVNTPLRTAHFMAQIEHESHLKPINENLNYSYERLLDIFKYDFDTNKDKVLSTTEKKVAELLARKPEQIANFVYANQNGNGDVNSGDGWRYRGRGFLQITGKENYKLLSKDTKIDFIKNPDLLLEEVNAIVGALWFWDKKGLNIYADEDNISTITKRINGGFNGIEDRKALLAKYKKEL